MLKLSYCWICYIITVENSFDSYNAFCVYFLLTFFTCTDQKYAQIQAQTNTHTSADLHAASFHTDLSTVTLNFFLLLKKKKKSLFAQFQLLLLLLQKAHPHERAHTPNRTNCCMHRWTLERLLQRLVLQLRLMQLTNSESLAHSEFTHGCGGVYAT